MRNLAITRERLYVQSTAWWAQRSEREKWLFCLCAFLVVFYAYRILIWTPIDNARADAVSRIEEAERTRAVLLTLDPQRVPVPQNITAPLRQRITESASAFGLPIQSLEGQDGRIELAFDRVAFEDLIEWLGSSFSQAGVTVTDARLSRRPEPGIVAASLVLEE